MLPIPVLVAKLHQSVAVSPSQGITSKQRKITTQLKESVKPQKQWQRAWFCPEACLDKSKYLSEITGHMNLLISEQL